MASVQRPHGKHPLLGEVVQQLLQPPDHFVQAGAIRRVVGPALPASNGRGGMGTQNVLDRSLRQCVEQQGRCNRQQALQQATDAAARAPTSSVRSRLPSCPHPGGGALAGSRAAAPPGAHRGG